MLSSRSKVFKDNVHGYISIPEDYVREFIDMKAVQKPSRTKVPSANSEETDEE